MRATKSVTSSSAKALSSESIGTAWRTFLKRPVGAAPTFSDKRFKRAQIGKALFDVVVTLAQRVVVGVADGRLVLLVIALVVLRDFAGEPRVLGLGLLGGQKLDRGFIGFDFRHRTFTRRGHR